MVSRVRVTQKAQSGWVVVGKLTYLTGTEIDVSDSSKFNPEEVKDLVQQGYLEEVVEELPLREAKA